MNSQHFLKNLKGSSPNIGDFRICFEDSINLHILIFGFDNVNPGLL